MSNESGSPAEPGAPGCVTIAYGLAVCVPRSPLNRLQARAGSEVTAEVCKGAAARPLCLRAVSSHRRTEQPFRAGISITNSSQIAPL